MTDEYFQLFLDRLPLTNPGPACRPEHLQTYHGVLPDPLLSYWQEYGFSGFGDGIVWLTDPLEWRATTELITAGIKHRPLGTEAHYIPILRSAFGEVWFWTPGYGRSLTLTPALATAVGIIQSKPSASDLSLQSTFAMGRPARYDFKPTSHPNGVFEQTLKRCGKLTSSQVYCFTPPVSRDGDFVDIDTADIADVHVWLADMKTLIGDWPTAYV
jgi:hypothetical protein